MGRDLVNESGEKSVFEGNEDDGCDGSVLRCDVCELGLDLVTPELLVCRKDKFTVFKQFMM